MVFICFAPSIIRAYRGGNGRQRAINSNLVTKILKQKFNPQQHKDTECVICMVDYGPNDEITPLPCDTKHYFHTGCIESWLKTNNSCPLCKKAITL